MADSCGNALEFIEGGVLTGVTAVSSTITNSLINSSVLESCHLKTLADLDAASAQTILESILALPPEKLSILANALQALVTEPPTELVNSPAQTTIPALPSTIYGARTALLGDPVAFAKFDDNYCVPVYRATTCP